MPLKIGYWTGWLRPEMEGISKEVFSLAHHFRGSWVFSLAPHHWVRLSIRKRYAGIHLWAWPFFKVLGPMVESRFDITHIYGGSPWRYLRSLGRRPVVLTAIGMAELKADGLDRVSALVVQCSAQAERCTALGLRPERVAIIPPGVDLRAFSPMGEGPSSAGFRVLFASAPGGEQELEGRGVWQIVEAAALLPEVQFVLLWRPWGESAVAVRRRVRALGLPNIEVMEERVRDMRTVYGRAHCVIAPFRQNGGKLVPTSVIEGLACGCPAVVTSHVGVAPLIAQYGAGEVCGLTPDSLARAIEQVRSAHQRMRVAARRLAEDRFDVAATVTAYRDVYHTLCGWPYAS